MRVLVVEDEVDVARFIRKGLVEQSYAVDVAPDGERALYMARLNAYDAAILDLLIPAPDGLDVCRTLRADGSTMPILFLTARGNVDAKIAGLDAGGDDYLAKPFEFEELLARLRALLRRTGTKLMPVITIGDLEIDTRSHRVRFEGQTLALTTKEYAIVEYLAHNSGRVVSRQELAEQVWNAEYDPFSNVIEVYINRLRRHLAKVSETKLIQTIRGEGYMLQVDAAAPAARH
ncbi:MAG TPA: response regulator transcription factor [Thermoanaerobaculia bacterium]